MDRRAETRHRSSQVVARLIFVLRESAEVPRPRKRPACILYEVICIERDHEVWPINYRVSVITATPNGKKTINCNDTNASVLCPPYRSLSLSFFSPLLCTLILHDYDLIATLHTEQESIACTTDRSCAGELTRDRPLMFNRARGL